MASNVPVDSIPVEEWLFNPITGEVSLGQDIRAAPKRTKNNDEGDAIAACWTSPLCPNKKEDGGRPDSCKGECADFLFAHPDELPADKRFLSELITKSEPKVALGPPSTRGIKRQEMDSPSDFLIRTAETSSPPDLFIQNLSTSPDTAATPDSLIVAPSTLSTSTPPPNQEEKTPKPSASLSRESAAIQASIKQKGRVPHNQVEKKYRENVNAQLEALRRVVPVSRQQLAGYDGFDIEDLGANARQPSKAIVLASATAYIKQLEKDKERMEEELANLKTQNKTLQSLVKCDDCSLMNYMKRWKLQPGV
jgi:Helix-loop-helix DNA-binding domain